MYSDLTDFDGMEFKELFENFAQTGSVTYISIRSKRLDPVLRLEKVLAIKDKGLDGDRYQNRGGARQVTIIQQEHLEVMASLMGKDEIDADLLRRNLAVKGINLLALKGKKFQIGEAILEYSGECHPCSRMEQNLGDGGYNAMRGHGGITARVIKDGIIAIGDSVKIASF